MTTEPRIDSVRQDTVYFPTVDAWRAAGAPEGTETSSVIIGTPPPDYKPPEPTPEPDTAKPDTGGTGSSLKVGDGTTRGIEPGMSAFQKAFATGIPQAVFEEGDVVEKDAKGNPTVMTLAGVRYYLPDSVEYQRGWRSEKERLSLDPSGQYLGIHPGALIPEDTIIITEGGKPRARFTRSQIGEGGTDDISDYIRRGEVRYPVAGYKGGQILLTPKQIERIETSDSDRQTFKLYQQFGVIDPKATYRTGEEIQALRAQEAASAFEEQQFIKRNTKLPDGQWISKADLAEVKKADPEGYKLLTSKGFTAYEKYVTDYNAQVAITNAGADKVNSAINKLEPHTKGDQVDVLAFIRANKDTAPETLADAGYKEKDIKVWVKQSNNPAYLNAVFMERVKEAKITSNPGDPGFEKDVIKLEKIWGEFSPSEQKIIGGEQLLTVAQVLGFAAGIAVGGLPGVAIIAAPSVAQTATHWAYLSTPEKAVAVTTEVASVALMIWGGKLISGGIKKLGSVGKAERLATKAGNEAVKLEKATSTLSKTMATADLKINQVALAADATAVNKAQLASIKADRAFLSQLDKVRALSPKDLAKLEKASGIKGLRTAVTDVSKAANEVKVASTAVKKSKFYTAPKTKGQIYTNSQHLVRLAKLQETRRNLELALAKADSTLKPRYSQEIPIKRNPLLEQFGAYQAKPPGTKPSLTKDEISLLAKSRGSPGGIRRDIKDFEKTLSQEEYEQYLSYLKTRLKIPQSMPAKEIEQKLKLEAMKRKLSISKVKLNVDKETQTYLDEILKGGKKTTPPKTEAQIRQNLERLSKESRAKYEAKSAEELKASRQAVAEQKKAMEEVIKQGKQQLPEVKPALRAKDLPKVAPEPRPKFGLPLTTRQKETIMAKPETYQEKTERLYGKEPLPSIDIRSKSITEELARTKFFEKLTPAEWTSVRELVKAGTEAHAKATTANLTSTQQQAMVKAAIQAQIKQQVKTQPQPLTKAQLKAVTRTTLKTALKPPIPPLKPPLKPRRPPPIFKRDKDRKRTDEELTPKERKGAVAWKQGIGWWVVLKDKRNFFTLKKPEGVTITERTNRPSGTIQAVKGSPFNLTADLGNKDIKITFPGGKRRGKIEFAHDPGQRTSQQIRLGRVRGGNGLKSEKIGRVYRTRIKGGALLSRRPLG